MNNFFKNAIFKRSIIAIISIIFVSSIIYIISSTYAASSYTVVFNRAENTEVMKTCKTDANGKLVGDCVSVISSICNKWSLESWDGNNSQDDPIRSSEFSNMTFSKDTNYYCVAGSSLPTAKEVGCYECNDNKNIMKWDTNGNSDSNCSSGYKKTNKSEAECVTVIPESCYVCNSDSNIMKWDNNGDSDSDCSLGYSSIDKPRSECKTVVPEVPENPQTGDILIYIVWIIGLGTLGYSLVYYGKMLKNKKC